MTTLEWIDWANPKQVARALTAAGAEIQTGGMIALIPDNPQAFTVPGGDPADQMHMTLCFLGDVADLDDATKKELVRRVEILAADNSPVEMRVQGVGIWNRDGGDTGDRKPSTNTLLQPADLAQGLRDYADQIGRDALGARYPEQFQPWAPHICAGYDLDPTVLPTHDGMVRFSKVRLALAGDDHDFVLAGRPPMDAMDSAPGRRYAQDGVIEMTETTVKDAAAPEVGKAKADGAIPVFFPCLAIEGMRTGDGRFIEPGALELRKPPLSIFAQTVNTGQGGHSGAEIVGNLTEAWKIPGPEFISKQTGEALPEGTFVWQGRGEVDPATNGGGLFAKKYLRGNSIDLAEAEFVDDIQFDDDGGEQHQVNVTSGFIGATTLCAIPAFRDAYGEIEGEEGGYSAAMAAEEMAGEGYPQTLQGLADFLRDRGIEPVTASVSIAELGDACSPCLAEGELGKLPPALAKNAAKKKAAAKAKIDDPEDKADGGADEADEGDGKPAFLKKKIKAKTAAGAPNLPPLSAFQNPNFTGPTPVDYDPDTRFISGHIATWTTCHIGVSKRCTPPPKSPSDYAYFNVGALRAVDDTGEVRTVGVGHLTMSTGHAGLSASLAETISHYDDTGTVAADVAAGDDAYGIWIAGLVRSELTDQQVHALLASAPSGDWRPKDGALELCAILAVNVPGYPVPRARVASGAPGEEPEIVALVAAGATRPASAFGPGGLDLDDLAARISARVLAELKPPTDDLADEQARIALELEQGALAEALMRPFPESTPGAPQMR